MHVFSSESTNLDNQHLTQSFYIYQVGEKIVQHPDSFVCTKSVRSNGHKIHNERANPV